MSDDVRVKKVGNRMVASWPDPHAGTGAGEYRRCPACTQMVPIIDGRVVGHEINGERCGGTGYEPMTEKDIRKRIQ